MNRFLLIFSVYCTEKEDNGLIWTPPIYREIDCKLCNLEKRIFNEKILIRKKIIKGMKKVNCEISVAGVFRYAKRKTGARPRFLLC